MKTQEKNIIQQQEFQPYIIWDVRMQERCSCRADNAIVQLHKKNGFQISVILHDSGVLPQGKKRALI
jgi:hypothetical protein